MSALVSASSSCAECRAKLTSNAICCKHCQTTQYCSMNCQIKHKLVHFKVCQPKAKMNSSRWGPDSTTLRLNGCNVPLPSELRKMPPNSIGGVTEDWTCDLPRNSQLYQRAFERLIDAYRLRVEDANVHANTKTGIYQKKDPLMDFMAFMKMAKKHRALPRWWNAQCDRQIAEKAKLRVQTTTTKSKIAAQRGPFEPMILRMMADKIYGIPLQVL